MSKTKNCKIDIVSVSVKCSSDSKKVLKFEEILLHDEVNHKEFSIKNKSVYFSVLENNREYIIGFIRTTIDKDLPAKINKTSKQISSLGLTNDEGIVYGNVFLYSKRLKVLFYEINRDSIYLDVFKAFVFQCFHSSETLKNETVFDLNFSTIFRKKEYERALQMDKYKGFKMKVHQPEKLLKEVKAINSTLEDKIDFDFTSEIQNAAEINSEYAEINYVVQYAQNKAGLNKSKVEKWISKLGKMLSFSQIREHITEIEICGYTTDYTSSQMVIDLIGDIYSSMFRLNIPRLNKDLQISERTKAIKEVYEKEVSILESYL